MRKTLIRGLSEKDMQAVVNTYTLSSFYFPTLFPLKFTPSLTWQSLQADMGAPVAGDVIAFDSRSPRKRREIVSKLNGDIPKIGVAREKTESEMNEYKQLQAYANTTEGAQAILDWIYGDQEFVFTGVNARLEWLALRAASTGAVVLSNTNNEGIVTEHEVDFLVPDAQKMGVAVSITAANSATSKPIKLFKDVVKAAKAKGKRISYAFMDQDTADNILASDETLKLVAPWVMQATNLTQSPDLPSLNRALAGSNLPQIAVIESYVQIEIKGVRTTVNPWEAGVILFSESATLGNTYHAPLADEDVESTTSLKVKRGHVLIKRYANEEPLVEVCLGMANAFPALGNAEGKYLVDTLNTSWTK